MTEAWIDRQLPQGDEVFLDHVGFFVHDLDEAGRQFEQLGFRVSQINVQTNADASGVLTPSGTSNRLARLGRGYLEILAATHDTPLADQLKGALARYQGIHLIALSHDDIPAQRTRLTQAGFRMQLVVTLRRRDKTLPGAPELAWSVLRPEPGVMAEGRVQFTKAHNPEHVWREELTAHPNGADGLSELLLCVEDRRGTAERYGRYVGRGPRHDENFSAVDLDRGRLVFVDPKEAAAMLPMFTAPSLPFIAGQALRTNDISATRADLSKNGVTPLFADDDLVCVGPDDVLSGYLLFHTPRLTAPWTELAGRVRA
jgi:catechol 2,3-dioxygenase-like lactoylglutathione lyase family enzyme